MPDPYGPAPEDNRLKDWSEFFADLENDFEAFTYKFAGVCFPALDEATQSAIADFFGRQPARRSSRTSGAASSAST